MRVTLPHQIMKISSSPLTRHLGMVKQSLKKKVVMPGTETARNDGNRSKSTSSNPSLMQMQWVTSAISRATTVTTLIKVVLRKDVGALCGLAIY